MLADTNRDCFPLKELRMFDNPKLEHMIDMKWPTMLSPDFDFHDMTFPMGGQVNSAKVGNFLMQQQGSAIHEADQSGRHVVIVTNSLYTPESTWEELKDGPALDGELLVKIFKALHYTVHEIKDTEDVLISVREVMDSLDRSTIKLMHFIYTGNQ